MRRKSPRLADAVANLLCVQQDWEKYSKPFTAAFRLAPDQDPAPNFQKPMRDFNNPHAGMPGGYPGPGGGYPAPMNQGPRPQVLVGQRPPPNANVLVLRPGDPRMGVSRCLLLLPDSPARRY